MSKSKPDVVLIHPGNRIQVYQSLGSQMAAIEPPIWAGLIASFLRVNGLSVEVIDGDGAGLGPAETAQQVATLDPLLTAVVAYGQHPSASTQTMPACRAVCSAIKENEPDRKTILVGGHVAALPEQTLREEQVAFVATGEGPYTVLDLAQALRVHAGLGNVRGLGYFEDGAVRFNEAAPLVWNLDQEMPGIAWDLLPMDNYRAHNWHCFGDLNRQPYASMYTTLGCPYRCAFCCIHAPFKSGERVRGMKEAVNSYRTWSVDSVISQLDILVGKYGVKNVKFADELFVLNFRHVESLCDLIIERGYDLNIWAYARVDVLREGLFEKMKRAGINWLAFGIESSNERVLDGVSKGFQRKTIFEALEKVQSAGINIVGNYIFGLPDDNIDSMQETLDLALEVNAEWANFYSAMAYPGSQLYQEAIRSKWPLPETWSGYSQHSFDCLPLPTKHVSAGEVLRFRDQAFDQYYRSQKYLRMIESKFGADTVRHIHKMLCHKLERKYAQC